jgi:hypothetical protein
MIGIFVRVQDEPKNRTLRFLVKSFQIFFQKSPIKGYFHAIFEKKFEIFRQKNAKVRFLGTITFAMTTFATLKKL